MGYVKDAQCDVAVIGLGFVGLPAAIMMAKGGLSVVGVDIDDVLLAKLAAGQCPIDEPGVISVFDEVKATGLFRAGRTVPIASAYIIAVPTPLHARKKVADLDALCAATESIVPHLRPGALIVVESTVPPLCCDETVRPIVERSGLKVGDDLLLAHCPERLYPGDVAREIIYNDRIIGGANPEATRRATELYATFVKGSLLPTDALTAEFCKLIENTYRDVNIALANELSLVAERLGTSIDAAIELANRHPRVSLLRPGIGVGGHCIPIDPWFIAEVAPEQTQLIPAARRINDGMPAIIAGRIRRAVANVADPVIGVYGVTYKPDVNDQRESPAWHVIELLRQEGFRLDVIDPIAGVGTVGTLRDLAVGKDALVILVLHQAAREELSADRAQLERTLRAPIILTF